MLRGGLLSALVFTLSHAASAAEPQSGPAPAVGAVKVTRDNMAQSVAFDAELRPFEEVLIHSKVTGYLKSIKVDAGDVVKAGDVIAILEVPELQNDLEQAEASARQAAAEIERAQAAYEEAHLVCSRLEAAKKAQPGLIAAQEMDTAKARDRVAEAAVAAAKQKAEVVAADIRKIKTMLGYTQITAPFSGVISKRFVDTGALIQAGASSGSTPLVRLSQNEKLRMTFPMSLSFATKVKVGDAVEAKVAALGLSLQGKVARFSRRMETSTRTMDVEVDLPNADLKIIPGLYATATVQLAQRDKTLVVPVEAITREKTGATVYVINPSKVLEERVVTVGLEAPTKVEVLTGVKEDELVLVGARAQLKPGQAVEPKVVTLPKMN